MVVFQMLKTEIYENKHLEVSAVSQKALVQIK